MSDQPSIRIEGISKQYRIGLKQTHHDTLGDAVTSALTAPLRWVRGRDEAAEAESTIWALNDVSLEVKQGELLGWHELAGANGNSHGFHCSGCLPFLVRSKGLHRPFTGSVILVLLRCFRT